MKKNLLGLIGSSCGLATVLVYGAAFMKVGTENYKISYIMLGVANASSRYYASSSSILSLSVIATIGVFFLALYGLVQALDGMKNKKDNSSKIFAGSSVSLFSAIYYFIVLNQCLKESTSVQAGIGAILFIGLSIAFFVLALLGMLIGNNKNQLSEDDKFNEIYKYKKLMDDGIITKEDFESYKNKILDKQ